MRPKDAREQTLPYKSKKLLIQEIVVQRLVVFLPVEDQEVLDPVPEGVLETHVCPDAVNPDVEAGFPVQGSKVIALHNSHSSKDCPTVIEDQGSHKFYGSV